MTTHILFDFFGTLVDYSPSRTEQGFAGSFALLREAGFRQDYQDFLSLWSQAFAQFDRAAKESGREFSMTELADSFLRRAIARSSDELVERLVETYLAEWNAGVRYPAGVDRLVAGLSERFTLGIVTNTHHADLVLEHLAQMGIAERFESVVTSVEYGRPKPAREIFDHALDSLGATAAASIYVGDSFEADYVGATGAGMAALLIDPLRRAPVPQRDRISSVFEIAARFGQ